jgi:predicted nicotinamide N-methyase
MKFLHFTLLAPRSRAFSTSYIPLRRIEVDLRPQLSDLIIAYERDNLEEDNLLERALGVQDCTSSINDIRRKQQFHDTLGLQAWPSGFVAARIMLDMLPDHRGDFTVLELGCGTGVPSLAAYKAGANAVATDLDVNIVSRSFNEQSSHGGNGYKCIELNLLDEKACEKIISYTRPNLVIAADCLYDATLANAVGQIMSASAGKYGCNILVADPGRLDGRGRELFLDSFLSDTDFGSREKYGFEDVDMPQELLRKSGASLSWCGVLETKVGIFTWLNSDIK